MKVLFFSILAYFSPLHVYSYFIKSCITLSAFSWYYHTFAGYLFRAKYPSFSVFNGPPPFAFHHLFCIYSSGPPKSAHPSEKWFFHNTNKSCQKLPKLPCGVHPANRALNQCTRNSFWWQCPPVSRTVLHAKLAQMCSRIIDRIVLTESSVHNSSVRNKRGVGAPQLISEEDILATTLSSFN